jgi:hypothetical protein
MIKWLKKFSQPKPGPAAAPVEATPAPAAPLVETTFDIPRDKVAQRAYEKWIAKGRPVGSSHQDWLEAEAELRAEYARQPAEALPHRPR